mgnify:CR=1 FL=1
MTQAIPRIAFTPGEPAGIGPDLAVILAQKDRPQEVLALADPELLRQRAQSLGLPIRLRAFDPHAAPRPGQPGELLVVAQSLTTPVTPGQLNPENSGYVLQCLDTALSGCRCGLFEAMVTGPVHKGAINDAGIAFSGHTEYLAEKTGVPRVVMMLATEGLRVALATTHLPLRDVADALTAPLLDQVLDILHSSLKRDFGLEQPRILVCGLNPHAGEGGHLGREEIDVLEPVLERHRATGKQLIGPLPADTLFTPKNLDGADAVLAMYHDQGLPVLKYRGFGRAANITLGLPIIRTSVDHGTALDLAGTGAIDSGSLDTALVYAQLMARARRGLNS